MLCLDSDARSRIKNSINGNGLSRVLATVDEFLHYHQKVEELDQSAVEKLIADFTSRMRGIVDLIRQSDRE